MQNHDFGSLSDAEISAGFLAECAAGRQSLARLLLWLDQVETRELHLAAACSSLWEYCRQRGKMSEGEATRRIAAARLVRRFPALLGPIERGELSLSSLVLLRDHLTETSFDALVAEASGKTKREVEEIVARLAPRPDVPARIDVIPQPVALPLVDAPAAAPPLTSPPAPAKVTPTAEDRYAVQFTASRVLKDKISRATELLRHRNPTGDLAANVERAFDALLEKLEKEVLAKTARPRRTTRPPKDARDVSRAARREVFERDGEQCTFVDDEGHRCTARGFLQIDHVTMRVHGGGGEAANLRIFCAAHNVFVAKRVLGTSFVEARRRSHRFQRTLQRVNPGACVSEDLIPAESGACVSEDLIPAESGARVGNGGNGNGIARADGTEGPTPRGGAWDVIATVKNGLVKMGFRDRDVDRALHALAHEEVRPSSPADFVRETLRLLT